MFCPNQKLGIFLIITSFLTLLNQLQALTSEDQINGFVSSTARSLRSKGYRAEDYCLPVQNGSHTLNLVRVINPLTSNNNRNKSSLADDSNHIEQKNHTNIDLRSIDESELEKLLANDHGSKSLVLTALNFGHQVWLLNRRPTLDSQRAHKHHQHKKSSPLKLDDLSIRFPKKKTKDQLDLSMFIKRKKDFERSDNYWNFSLDEQAIFDIPEVVDCVLEKSKRKRLALVGFGAGATISMMALAEKPNLASKISRAIFWAPFFDLSSPLSLPVVNSIFKIPLIELSKSWKPFPSNEQIPRWKHYLSSYCANSWLRQITVCRPFVNLNFGLGANSLQLEHLGDSSKMFIDSSSMPELAQYVQALIKRQMHRFDHMNSMDNYQAYGKSEPPIWDISKISLKTMSFWVGKTDKLSPVSGFKMTKDRLKVPYEVHELGHWMHWFNHLGFLMHEDITKLLVIPSLKAIESPT